MVDVWINGRKFEQSLPRWLGLQNSDPAHLAFPATAVIEIPPGVLKQGTNVMEIRVKNDGWFTWDSITMCTGGKNGEGDQ